MKPYFAVLYDSFLESVRSKVLWILLAAWTLILLALFPLALSQGESYGLTAGDIRAPKTIMDQLAGASSGKGTRKQKAIYAKLDEDFQNILKQRQSNQRRIAVGKLIEAFNKLLKVKDLYDAEVWPTAAKRNELKDLIAKDDRSALELEKLNRGLIDLAFEGSMKSSSGQATWITYGGLKLGSALPFSETQIRPFIETGIFPLVMRLGLGIAAMFVAVIITSPMIPDMFQTGSLHLLLSKPISRSLLFLTKFVGGCTFVGVNIVYLLFGLYLYAGTRLEIWNSGILWCIPLFIFTFMIFYSVSALVGLFWKNPIICVVITALFWGVCFSVGLIHTFFDAFLNVQNQPQRITSIKGQPILSTQQGRIQFWNPEERSWKTAFGDADGQRVLGPAWIEQEKSLYFARVQQLPFGIRGGQDTQLSLAHLPDLTDPKDTSFKSKFWDDGRLDTGPNLPSEPLAMFPWRDTFAVFTEDGVFRFDPQVAGRMEQQKTIFGGFDFGVARNLLQTYPSMTPKNWGLSKPMDIGVAPSFKSIVLYSKGSLTHWMANESGESLSEAARIELNIDEKTIAIVGANDRTAIVCPVGFKPRVVDLESKTIRNELEAVKDEAFNQIKVGANGQFALLTGDGKIWLVSQDGSECKLLSLTSSRKALAIHFDENDRLWVTYTRAKTELIDLAKQEIVESYSPRLTTPQFIFDYIVNPFYQVNPKPSAMNETIEYVLKNPKNKTLALDRGDLDAPKVVADPWTPLWSNMLFVAVMLGVSCWYLYRQDL
jgi:ABC-type transport system involved in multi-copper enzyme maturation permease subunit